MVPAGNAAASPPPRERGDRIPSAVWLAILWAGMIAGFGLDFPRYLAQKPPAPFIVHAHAAVFTGWLLLLTAQVTLVLRDRLDWHRRLGRFMVGWACLMAVFGPWAAFAMHRGNFLSISLLDMAGFLVLLAWGFALRTKPSEHRRMMILATLALADPGFSRISMSFMPDPAAMIPFFIAYFYGNVLLVGLMLAWDLSRGRLVRSFVAGAGALLATELIAVALYFWPPWIELTKGL